MRRINPRRINLTVSILGGSKRNVAKRDRPWAKPPTNFGLVWAELPGNEWAELRPYGLAELRAYVSELRPYRRI
jgi:hypothetical protein